MKQPMQQVSRKSPLIQNSLVEPKEFFANNKADDEWELVADHSSGLEQSPVLDNTSDEVECVTSSDSSDTEKISSSSQSEEQDDGEDRVDQLANAYTEKSGRVKASRSKQQSRRRQKKNKKKCKKASKKIVSPIKCESVSTNADSDSVMELSDVEEPGLSSNNSTAAVASAKDMEDSDISSEVMDDFSSSEIATDASADEQVQLLNEEQVETTQQPTAAVGEAVGEAAAPMAPPVVYKKGDELFYRRASETTTYPPLKIKIVGVHHDDFPNIYYTIQTCPRNEQVYLADPEYPLFEERQTDNKYLYPIDHIFEDCTVQSQSEKKTEEEELLDSASVSENEHDPSPSPVETSSAPSPQQQQNRPIAAPTPFATSVPQRTASAAPIVRALPVEVREFESYYLVQGRAPGVGAADLQVTVEEDNSILIKAFSHSLGVSLQQQVKFPAQLAVDLPRTAVRLNGGILSLQVPKVARKPLPQHQRRPMYSSSPFENSSRYNSRPFNSPFSSPFNSPFF